MTHGGKRQRSGRKSKAEEQQLVERLSPLEDIAHQKLKAAINDGEQWAIKMYFEYMYGKPRQTMDVTTKGDKITNVQIEVIRSDGDA